MRTSAVTFRSLLMALVLSALALPALASGPALGISGERFTLDGRRTFLLGASYYGGLAIEKREILKQDLDDLDAHGFNWIRLWATWDAFDNNISAVAPDGSAREPYMGRLKRLCRMAGKRGMVVDVTVTREKADAFPSQFSEHLAVMEALARELKTFRNVYFDIGNERNVGDARHVAMDEVGRVIEAVKRIDPQRLCTASEGGDISGEEVRAFIDTGHVDFICPHRPRNAESPSQTAARTREYFTQMKAAQHAVPVHYQEPFRRDYGRWSPKAADFIADLEAAKEGGAAGWCFHNGSVRPSRDGDGRPRRSFDMRPAEGRLFEQLDAEEQAFMRRLKAAEASR